MEIVVNRKWRKAGYSVGRLTIGGQFICNTLEDEDRGLDCTMSTSEIRRLKVYGRTAIPVGRYLIRWTYSQGFAQRPWARPDGGFVPLLENVKGFDGIRIHPGNKAADTFGCILVGRNTIKGGLTASQDTYRKLVDEYLKPCWKRGENAYLTITK